MPVDRTTPAVKGARIDLRGMTKRFGGSVAVDDVTLTVEPGEFMTFLGPSGSGKTTTLNMIAGFTDITAGTLEIDDRPVGDTPAHKRDIGVVFQHYALFPHMTVAENIAFPLRQRKISKDERRRLVAAALETVQLPGHAARYPGELSGGQQQRVALARAIVFSPRVLLMDEPLGALDRKLREFLQLEIKRIHREVGSTFVFVTHDQEEALILSDRIAVFNNAKIEQVGTAHELYERPATLFVARFLGESTILRGAARPEGAGSTLTGDGFAVRAPGRVDAGRDAALVVRPERLRLIPDEPGSAGRGASGGTPGGNAVPVTVLEEIYLGAARKLEVVLPGGARGLVREQAGALSGLRAGDRATLTWHPDDGVLLPDDPTIERIFT
ncbi:ABC transporter ATP-binding protein [Microtetraspora niveoalba]|uniref:ABC transporter ATP-binding protein n=1 Tax=Microtetraspora niveoalba TaxID=46175 RepID=UPI000AED7458|nr:ABC transporter ATP-binding protein [Microtetraspora niveoalba]